MGGFSVQITLMDMEFEKVRDFIPIENIDISASNDSNIY